MSGRRRRNRRDREDSFNRKREEIKRREEEERLNRQQRTMTKKSMTTSVSNMSPTGGSNVQKIDGSVKTEEKSCEKETADFKKSPLFRRSKESPQNSRTTTRSSSSSRFDAFEARNINRNLNYKKRKDLPLDDDNAEGCEDNSTLHKNPKRHKIASPFSKRANAVYSSPARLKKNYATRQESMMKDENDDISSAKINSAASPYSIASPSSPGVLRSQRSKYRLDNATDFDGRKTIACEKVSSSSQSTTVSKGEQKPINTTTTTENDPQLDSDGSSDGSFNMLSAFKQREKSKNQASKQETTKSERSDDPHSSRTNNPRKGDDSISFSEDDDEEDLKDRNQNSRLRKKNKNEKMPRKQRAADDEDSEDSSQKNTTIIRKSSSVGKKKIVNRDNSSSDSFSDEESVLETDDDESRSSIRHQRNKKPRNPIALEYDANDQFFMAATETGTNNKKTSHSSFVDDDDDGFMSDCDPLPAPSTGRSAKEDTTSRSKNERTSPGDKNKTLRKKRRKRATSKENNDRLLAFDNDDNDDGQYEKDCGDTLDDLHPNFKNPKFGPYEPMESLLLSNDQNETLLQVPDSLNRYLVPFQKEGVRFMYKCLARKSGVILGDEMGCGKTVQVIALLCALFNKTGTRKDLLDIRDRNAFVRKQILKVQKLKDQAMHMGEVLNENIGEWNKTLSLSPWNPVMIIVPPTILDTWKTAFETFSHFSVSFYSSKTKMDAIQSVLYGGADILIVPKSAFQDERHLNELKRVKWKLIVIDEFHNFKNYKAKISIHLRELKELHHPLILGMTGTPMQNNHTELWNLVDLVETNYFGTKDEFKNNIDRPITVGRHKCVDPRAKARSEAASAELRKGLNKIYIKREKKDVLKGQLPEKNEELILCDLSPLQNEVYRHVIKLPDFDLVKHGSRPCDCGINQNFFRKWFKLKSKAEQLEYMRTNKSKIVNQSKCCKTIPANPRYGEKGEPFIDQDAPIWRTLDAHCSDDNVAKKGCDRCPWCCTLPCLTKLNKLSSHLGLLQATKTTEAIGSPSYIKYKKEKEFAKVALAGVVDRLPGGDYDRSDGIMDDHFSLSGKLRVLNDLLKKDYNEGGKVLLFSHSTQSLDLIENWLKSRGSFEYRRMDGSTPISKRQHLTDEFNNTDHIFLFLLSIKAAGLGLNLTSANRVIMFDVSWNPSWEIQAQDRAHRIGQTRDVRVVRLISKGTVEEMIYLRQIYKEHLKQDTLQENDDLHPVAPRLFRGVQGDKYRKGEIFGTENLFRFKEDGSFLDDVYKSKNKGNGDSSGLEIHDSRNISKVLLGMTDEEKQKEEDDLVILQAMSGKAFSNRPIESSGSIGQQEPHPADHDQAMNEPIEEKFLAINHRDFFRSDRGGAAINSGEVGFDEEMGGQTQAAYEIYENIKNNLGEEEGNSDDDVVNDDDDKNYRNQGKECEDDRNQSDLTLQEKSVIFKKVDETQTTSLKNPMIANKPTVAQTRSDPESNVERKLALDSTPAVHENCRSEIYVPKNDSAKESYGNTTRSSNQTKNKVLLMGCININDAKSEFSAADLRRPIYGRKKKKKKKEAKLNAKSPNKFISDASPSLV